LLLAVTLTLAGCSDEPQKPNTEKKSNGSQSAATTAKPSAEKTAADKTSEEHPNTNQSPAEEKAMSITTAPYGKMPDGTEIEQFTLSNGSGMKVKLVNYGAIITSVEVPDRNGKSENVTLYRDSLADYMETKDGKPTTPYFGATVGRYGNRIAKGRFTLDGRTYTLATNNGPNALHGGFKGFDKKVWKHEDVKSPGVVGIAFTRTSPDDEEGYPGNLKVKVTYSLTDKNELKMDYEATTDKNTVVNLTNHTYWNLAGAGNGDILKHELMLDADSYLPVDNTLIPLGRLEPVKGTPFDFTKSKPIGKDMVPFDPVKTEGGYDHCYVLNRKGDGLVLAAKVSEPTSGRVMEVYTTQPAVQFYVGNFLDGSIHAGGKDYKRHYGFCLETQHYPDSPNQKDFPTTELKPGETYKQSTVHKFSVLK
jgi:aldose 1-epimerase